MFFTSLFKKKKKKNEENEDTVKKNEDTSEKNIQQNNGSELEKTKEERRLEEVLIMKILRERKKIDNSDHTLSLLPPQILENIIYLLSFDVLALYKFSMVSLFCFQIAQEYHIPLPNDKPINLDTLPNNNLLYKDLKVLHFGEGRFLEATNTETGKKVIIKENNVESDTCKKIFEIEISIMKKCTHPNYLRFIDAHIHNEHLRIVTDYMDGVTLNDIVHCQHSVSPLNENQMVCYKRNITVYCSPARSSHPTTYVLIDTKGRVFVHDFNYVIQVALRTSNGPPLYPFYMAPEAITMTNHGKKSDIWSLGTLLREMAEGEPPYMEITQLRALFNITTKGLPPLTLPNTWSEHLKDFLNLCLIKDPFKRPSALLMLDHPFLKKAASAADMIPLVLKTKERPLN